VILGGGGGLPLAWSQHGPHFGTNKVRYGTNGVSRRGVAVTMYSAYQRVSDPISCGCRIGSSRATYRERGT
jgi:hypothetical protein